MNRKDITEEEREKFRELYLQSAEDYQAALQHHAEILKEEFSNYVQSEIQTLKDYLGFNDGYAWHISKFYLYVESKELSEFCVRKKTGCPAYVNGICVEKNQRMSLYFRCENLDCQYKKLTRPPQSWCYVEGVEGE